MYEGGSSNRDAAIEDFRQAVAITPSFAVAWAEMARAFIQNARAGTTALDPAFREARSAAQKAAELEPDSPEGLVALGWVRRTADWDWRGAEQAFRRALVLRPDGGGVVTDASVMINNSGHIAESIRLAERAVELDPLNPEAYYNLSMFLGNDNQLAASEKAQRRAVELAPHADQMHRFLSNALADLGRLDEAALEAELEPAELDRIEARALILLRRGRKAEALALAQQLEHGTNNLQDLAELYALADERDLAFATLDKSVARHETGIVWLKVDSYFANLHRDPRWAALLRKVNLADDQLK
jgi:tetratricopeptide (TPR) repeat protein